MRHFIPFVMPVVLGALLSIAAEAAPPKKRIKNKPRISRPAESTPSAGVPAPERTEMQSAPQALESPNLAPSSGGSTMATYDHSSNDPGLGFGVFYSWATPSGDGFGRFKQGTRFGADIYVPIGLKGIYGYANGGYGSFDVLVLESVTIRQWFGFAGMHFQSLDKAWIVQPFASIGAGFVYSDLNFKMFSDETKNAQSSFAIKIRPGVHLPVAAGFGIEAIMPYELILAKTRFSSLGFGLGARVHL